MVSVRSQKYAPSDSSSSSSSSSSSTVESLLFRGQREGEVWTKPLEVVWSVLAKAGGAGAGAGADIGGEGEDATTTTTTREGEEFWRGLGAVCVDYKGEASVMNQKQVHSKQQHKPKRNRTKQNKPPHDMT